MSFGKNYDGVKAHLRLDSDKKKHKDAMTIVLEKEEKWNPKVKKAHAEFLRDAHSQYMTRRNE